MMEEKIIHKPDEMIKYICLTKSLKLNSAYSRFLFQFAWDMKKTTKQMLEITGLWKNSTALPFQL